jgi:hypothetical protein
MQLEIVQELFCDLLAFREEFWWISEFEVNGDRLLLSLDAT